MRNWYTENMQLIQKGCVWTVFYICVIASFSPEVIVLDLRMIDLYCRRQVLNVNPLYMPFLVSRSRNGLLVSPDVL